MLHLEPSFIKLAIVLTTLLLLSLRISGTGEKYKIYIPEGSITTDFQVDME